MNRKFSDYIVYVDESGHSNWTAAPEYPLLCLNFCMFDKEYYINKIVPKFNTLKFKYWGCDNLILHERDLRKSDKIKNASMKSKYQSLYGERKKVFLDELSNFMEQADFISFCVVMDKNKIPNPHKSFDPYNICLSRGFRQIWEYLNHNNVEELEKDLHIIFESRGRNEDRELSKAYQQIQLSGSLAGQSARYDFSNFKLEIMDKKSNSSGLQIADLTARSIGNHYLHGTDQRQKVDLRSAQIILEKMIFCTDEKCEKGAYDIVHDHMPK